MRLFVAVFPSPDSIQPLRVTMTRLQKAFPKIRWVQPENMHFTLAFLGETAPDNVQRVQSAISRTAQGMHSFQLAFGDIGVFDSWQRPRVLWMGLKTGVTELSRLASAVRAEFSEEGLAFDPKPFVPHLTLARIPAGRPAQDFQEKVESTVRSLEFVPMEIKGFDLVSSQAKSGSPVYSVLQHQGFIE